MYLNFEWDIRFDNEMPEKQYKVTMSKEERGVLHEIVTKGKWVAYKRTRAQVLLKSDESHGQSAWTDKQISDAFDISVGTVERIRKTFVLEGLEQALKRKKQERPSYFKFDGEKESKLIALCCSPAPEGHQRWSLRLLADKLVELNVFDSISHKSVGEHLKKTNLNLG